MADVVANVLQGEYSIGFRGYETLIEKVKLDV